MSKDNDFFSKLKLFLSDTEHLKKFFPAINSAGYPFIALFFFHFSFTIFTIRFFWLDRIYTFSLVCIFF